MKIIDLPKWYPLKFVEGFGNEQRKESFMTEIFELRNHIYIKNSISELDIDDNYTVFKFIDTFVFVNKQFEEYFRNKFRFHIKGDEIFYDNLVNLCIMVKNAGEGFREMLRENSKYIDRWTILDTGSTDNTISIINEVLGEIPGELYQEPFINFRDSRNRLLDLAGYRCAFNIMLDDTYVLKGNVREFLTFLRSDFVADCFSLNIEDIDTMYNSCRVTRPFKPNPNGGIIKLNLRYINIIHEIIDTRNYCNVAIPYEQFSITDVSSPYMQTRTKERKLQDIKLLEQELIENPQDPRSYYYIADSYILMKDYVTSLKYFKLRAERRYEGYSAEVQDSLYYIAVLSEMTGVEWEKCHQLYLDCYNFDTSRPDSLYLIGRHYLDHNQPGTALLYLEKAFEIGTPEITMSMRKNMYGYHIPYDLLLLCYNNKKYSLGERCCRKIISFVEATNYKIEELDMIRGWLEIFYLYSRYGGLEKRNDVFNGRTETKTIVFVSPGGWSDWFGETLYSKGLGGSETFTVKYGETLAKMGYQVIVFCKTDRKNVYNDVLYFPIDDYPLFLSRYKVDICLINRYQVYTHISILKAEKTYLILHDLTPLETIIPTDDRLTGILFLSEFQKEQFLSLFGAFRNRCHVISYGIDTSLFPSSELVSVKDIENGHWTNGDNDEIIFVYPSFPNRGLLPLLHIFPSIISKYPNAKLHIFCETKHQWVQQYHKEVADKIDEILEQGNPNITNHGWVNGEKLRSFWKKAHIWLYPCVFEETFCMTALESAMSKTLMICSDLGALPETVGDRGIIIPGDPNEDGWKIFALNRIFNILDGFDNKEQLIESTYEWARSKDYSIVVEDFRQKYIEN